MIYLSEKGRIPADIFAMLRRDLAAPDTIFRMAVLDDVVVDAVARISRNAIPDMPDRLIAATALGLGLPLISRDGKIRLSGIPTVW